MHEDDDIVVCPECATPQHRSCWLENGHCINQDKHGTDFIWTPDSNKPEQNVPDSEPNTDFSPKTIICNNCGSENSAGMSFCGHCGFQLNQPEKNSSEGICPYCGKTIDSKFEICPYCGAPITPFSSSNFKKYSVNSGMDDNEIIGGHTVGELSIYIRTNVAKYLSKFKNIAGGNGISFNWAAFVFGPLWFFFRKIYKAGIFLLLVSACIGLIVSSASETINSIMYPYAEQITDGTISQEVMTELMEKIVQSTYKPISIAFILLVILHIICALTANRIYYKKINSDFNVLNQEVSDINMRRMLLSSRGGTSLLSGFCGYFTYQIILSVFIYIADFAATHF